MLWGFNGCGVRGVVAGVHGTSRSLLAPMHNLPLTRGDPAHAVAGRCYLAMGCHDALGAKLIEVSPCPTSKFSYHSIHWLCLWPIESHPFHTTFIPW